MGGFVDGIVGGMVTIGVTVEGISVGGISEGRSTVSSLGRVVT